MIRHVDTEPPAASVKPELPYISPSSIKSYLTCSLKYYFEKVLRLHRPTSPSLHIGKAVHEGVRRYHLSVWREEGLVADQIAESYRAAFAFLEQEEAVTFKDEAQRETSLATGERVVRAYLESEAALITGKPAGVEVRLEERIPELPAPLYGIIDLVAFPAGMRLASRQARSDRHDGDHALRRSPRRGLAPGGFPFRQFDPFVNPFIHVQFRVSRVAPRWKIRHRED